MNTISVQPITDRPIIDAIAPDDFMLIGDASDNNVVKRVLVSSLKSFFTIASSNYIAVLANRLLESNKSYLATVSGLTLLLPLNPSIGDKIELATGNFDLMVEQNTNQIIQNLSTPTTLGSSKGVVLKPYSSICLVFIQSGLWISTVRSRVISNYRVVEGELVGTLKAYTPSIFGSATLEYGTIISNINNNQLVANDYGNNGLLVGESSIRVLAQFSQLVNLTGFDFYGGQGNLEVGATHGTYRVSTINVYSGNNLDNLIGIFNPINSNGVKQTFNVDTGNSTYDTYIFEFTKAGGQIGILELDLFGKAQIGGEVIAV